ncbi:MAG: 2-hydroxymuconic semialdehyde dehydrogenase [Euryarchaeota archaeon]|nr:2-hydroxymuconic semialdehyde dehydrogenase [Euryarchaeota archaeon]|tara:strand:+ start:21291 stop:22724 length:1434 start_codon:yes stop_codon:yes gene_type:complete
MILVRNYVNGIFVDSKETIEDINPATSEVIATIPRSNLNDVNEAVLAADKARDNWSSLSLDERRKWLEKIANALEARSEEIAKLESLDTGKPIKIARAVDASRSVANFRFFAEFSKDFHEQKFLMEDATNHVIFKPVGIAGLITPWNLPLYLLSWKIAPAIVMGNTVVAKPSELTPLTANLLAEVFDEVGLPAGVVNIVHGFGHETGQAIVSHPLVNLISFTGGTITGKKVAETAAPMFKKLSLELGGKNATIVLDDVNLDSAIPEIARSGFLNQGQVCLCGSRILVSDKIWDDFLEKFIVHVSNMKIGDPSSDDSDLGALVSLSHRDKVESYIHLAEREGGEILYGGKRPSLESPFDEGSFLEPTIVSNLDYQSRTATEEIFGPVVTLHKFEKDEDAVEMANCTDYGLAGSVWTSNSARGKSLAEKMETGMVWINTWLHRDLRVPFGGVKNSGVGTEGGRWSLSFFSQPVNICVKE